MMNYTLSLYPKSIPSGGDEILVHTGDDPSDLWDMVDLQVHLHARLEDLDGNLVAKYTSSDYTEAE